MHLHHILAALKRYFPVSVVAPLPNSEQINLPSSNHTYTKSMPKHIYHHYSPSVTSTHTTHIISSTEPTSSSSVYNPFSDRVGLPPYNTFFPRVLMKSIGAVFLRPDTLPDVNHMRGMQYQIVINIIAGNQYKFLQLLHKMATLIYAVKHTHHIVTPGFVDRPAGMVKLLARWRDKLAGGPEAG